MENEQEAMYPAGIQVNEELFARKESTVGFTLDFVRQAIEQALLMRNQSYPHSGFDLMEVSMDPDVFVWNYTDEQGKLTTFRTKWSTEHGYPMIEWTGTTVFETNAPLYPTGTIQDDKQEIDVNAVAPMFTEEELANAVEWAENLATEHKKANIKLDREFVEDQEPLLPIIHEDFERKVAQDESDESPLLPNTSDY